LDDLPALYPGVARPAETATPEERLAALSKERERLLAAHVNALRTIPEMRRALLLQEWRQDPTGDDPLTKMDQKYRSQLAKRFQESVSRVLLKGNEESQLGVLNMLAESGPTIRTIEDTDRVQTVQDDVANLVRKGQTATVRAAAALALGQIFPPPDVAAPALRSLLEPPHTVTERRAAAAGLFNFIRLISQPTLTITADLKAATKAEANPREILNAGKAVLSAASPGLADPDPEVRRWCARAIYQAAAGLSTHGPHPGSREATGIALPVQQLRQLMLALREKASLLKDALNDTDLQVRLWALQALEQAGTARQQFERSAPNSAVVPGAGDPVLETLKTTLPSVIRDLSDPAVQVRLRALDVLETMGPQAAPAVPSLVRATADPNVFVRWASARGLGEIGPLDTARTVPALARLVFDRDLDVGLAATKALERYGPAAKAAIPDLILALRATDARKRLAAIAALEGIGTDAKTAIPALSVALTDVDMDVRRAAADLLAKFGPAAAGAEPALRRALEQSLIELSDPNERVREQAAKVRQAVSDAMLSIMGDR
jgi:HEAT repeat protein